MNNSEYYRGSRFIFALSKTSLPSRKTTSAETYCDKFSALTKKKKKLSVNFTYVIPMCFTNTYNFNVSHTHTNYYTIQVYLWATCFDSFQSSSGPTKSESKAYLIYRALWDPKRSYIPYLLA